MAGKDVPAGALERVERRNASTPVERDRHPCPPGKRLGERKPSLEEAPGSISLEPEEGSDPVRERSGEVVVPDAKARHVVLRQIDAAERQVARRILEEVDELEAGA